jgi:hypothetical protein
VERREEADTLVTSQRSNEQDDEGNASDKARLYLWLFSSLFSHANNTLSLPLLLFLDVLPSTLILTIARANFLHSIITPAPGTPLRPSRQTRPTSLLGMRGFQRRRQTSGARRGRRVRVVELFAATRAATTHDEAAVTIGAALVFVVVVVVAVEGRFVAVGRVAFLVFDELGAESGFGAGEAVEGRVGVFGAELAFDGVEGGGFGDDGGDGGVGDRHGDGGAEV